jgi:hypothetical protein
VVASWDDLVSFVRVRYEIMRQVEDELWFNLPTSGERTQLVVVRLVSGEDSHFWAQITSPIGRAADLDLARLLVLAGESIAGGAVATDGFDRSFRVVVEVADRLEHELTGSDEQ